MRLLNVHDFRFVEFYDYERPAYAILSHCWAEQKGEEVSFREFYDAFQQQDDSQKGLVWKESDWTHLEKRSGFWKIQNCCKLARERGLHWVWIDTCCIDKTSSAELTEAINSMYRWYQEATECYTYMFDVVWMRDNRGIFTKSFEAFRRSRWFQRGWTLQELLAPKSIIFFDCNWRIIGTKDDLTYEISNATGIRPKHLYSRNRVSIAAKMSWAAGRATRRPEDIAYCLLGIFDVNMALLYGEGVEKAFIRLQLEIIKKSDDESIFAWTSHQYSSGMLATSPDFFADSGDIKNGETELESRLPYSMTNKGLEFHVPTLSGLRILDAMEPKGHTPWLHPDKAIWLALNCWIPGEGGAMAVTIVLRKSDDTWYRTNCQKLEWRRDIKKSFDDHGVKTTRVIYVKQDGM